MSLLSGSTRGGGGRALSRHLLAMKSNESVETIEPRGLIGSDLHAQLLELTAGAITTRTAKPIYHVHFDPVDWTDDVRMAFWARFEGEFGLEGARYCGAIHQKHGRRHEHRCYDITADDGAVTNLSFDRLRREKIAVLVAHEFQLAPPPIKHVKSVMMTLMEEGHHEAAAGLEAADHPDGRLSPRTPDERAIEERTSGRKVDAGALALSAWTSSDDGRSFQSALVAQGLVLAQGDRVPVVLDHAGAAWPIGRLLGQASKAAGVRIGAAEVKRRLTGIDLPSIEDARHERRKTSSGKSITTGIVDAGRVAGPAAVEGEAWSENTGGSQPSPQGRGGNGFEHLADIGPAFPERGGEPGFGGFAGDNFDAAPPTGDDRGNGDKAVIDRRAAQQARAKVEIAQANQNPAAVRILEMARQVTQDTQLGVAGRLLREIQAKEDQAHRRIRLLDRPIMPPADLIKTRDLTTNLHNQAQQVLVEEREAALRVEELDSARPRGLWAWVLGKTKRHDQVLRATRVEHDKIAYALRSAQEAHSLMVRRTKGRNDGWNRKLSAIEEERAAERSSIMAELAWLADARLCIGENPRLAYASPVALTKAVERLQLDRTELASTHIQQEPERRKFSRAPSYRPR